MSTREKNLLIYFLGLSRTDNGCTKKYDEVIRKVTQLAHKLGIKSGTKQMKYFMELEDEIVDLFDMTKNAYFDFGKNANEVIEEYDLDWTPEKTEEIRKVA